MIDTPGVFDTSAVKAFKSYLASLFWSTKATLNELAKVFDMAPGGFDAIILVARYGTRFTGEETGALEILVKFLGEKSKDNMIVVLTHGDEASRKSTKEGASTEDLVGQWLESLPEWVQGFLKEIKNRVVVFNNTHDASSASKQQVAQVEELVKVIDHMTAGREPFINDLTKASEEQLNKHIEEAMKVPGLFNEPMEQQRLRRVVCERRAIAASEHDWSSELTEAVRRKTEEVKKNSWCFLF